MAEKSKYVFINEHDGSPTDEGQRLNRELEIRNLEQQHRGAVQSAAALDDLEKRLAELRKGR